MKKAPVETDLRVFCGFAVRNGAGGAKAVDGGLMAVDERVQLGRGFERLVHVVLRGECFG